MGDWIPVGERLPDDEHDVQVMLSNGKQAVTYRNSCGGFNPYPWLFDPGRVVVTHWRELPADPAPAPPPLPVTKDGILTCPHCNGFVVYGHYTADPQYRKAFCSGCNTSWKVSDLFQPVTTELLAPPKPTAPEGVNAETISDDDIIHRLCKFSNDICFFVCDNVDFSTTKDRYAAFKKALEATHILCAAAHLVGKDGAE